MWWVVEIQYNTEADGKVVPPDSFPKPRTVHGPFKNGKTAVRWMNNRVDDTDVYEMLAFELNHPKAT